MAIPLLLLAAGAYALSAKRTETAAGKLSFTPKSVDLDKTNKTLKVTFSVLNPTNKAVNIQSLFGTVYADDKAIGTIEQGKGFKITKLGRSDVSLPIKPNVVGLTSFLAKAILMKKARKVPTLKVLGEVRSMGISAPINETVNLSGL
jgi:hypothetical protein